MLKYDHHCPCKSLTLLLPDYSISLMLEDLCSGIGQCVGARNHKVRPFLLSQPLLLAPWNISHPQLTDLFSVPLVVPCTVFPRLRRLGGVLLLLDALDIDRTQRDRGEQLGVGRYDRRPGDRPHWTVRSSLCPPLLELSDSRFATPRSSFSSCFCVLPPTPNPCTNLIGISSFHRHSTNKSNTKDRASSASSRS